MFRSNRRLEGLRILVTGASSGIGRALALALAQHGARLVLTARREGNLHELCSKIAQSAGEADRDSSVVYVAGDVTDSELRQRLLDTANQAFGGLDVLINNAGMGAIGTFESADADRLRRVMELNLFAAVDLIRDSLPLLRQSSDPAIVNVGSVLGHCAVPKKTEYCASKFAMHGFSDALRMEVAPDGIDVILVSPSTTSSEFFDRALRSEGKAAENRFAMSPDAVAQRIVVALRRRKREVILSWGGKMLVYADRICPSLISWVLQRMA